MRIGSLFSGVGMLDVAVSVVFDAEMAWHSEVNPAAAKVLEYQCPGVPNLGDITQVNWSQVEPVDILCGGFPCQDVSCAGRRAGLGEGTRSGLWSYFAYAIAVLKPPIVVIENVRGLLSAKAKMEAPSGEEDVAPDDVERPANDVGVLRAAGAVLGDLSDLGYDAQWTTLAASAVGAPHKRERVFILATRRNALSDPADGGLGGAADARGEGGEGLRAGLEGCGGPRGANAADAANPERRDAEPEHLAQAGWSAAEPPECLGEGALGTGDAAEARAVGVTLLPTPTTQPATGNGHARNLGKEVQLLPTPRSSRGASTTEISYALGGERRDDDRPQGEVLLPTPTVQDSKSNGGAAQHERNTPPLNVVATLMPTPQARDWKEGMSNQRDLNDAILREDVTLLPTPSASDRFDPGRSSAKQGGDNLRTVCCNETVSEENHVPEVNWGKYAEAVKRWEGVTRPAPSPTEPNAKGNPRLAPMFAEWMMGWPEGWVTDPAIGLTRNDQLKAIGNGVVPHQAIAALRSLLPHAGIKVGDG